MFEILITIKTKQAIKIEFATRTPSNVPIELFDILLVQKKIFSFPKARYPEYIDHESYASKSNNQ